jgi:hypothetical protein
VLTEKTDRLALTAFLPDSTVSNAINSGFRINTFKIRSLKGVEYEYCIQNVNELLIPYQLEEIVNRQKLIDKKAFLLNHSSGKTMCYI